MEAAVRAGGGGPAEAAVAAASRTIGDALPGMQTDAQMLQTMAQWAQQKVQKDAEERAAWVKERKALEDLVAKLQDDLKERPPRADQHAPLSPHPPVPSNSSSVSLPFIGAHPALENTAAAPMDASTASTATAEAALRKLRSNNESLRKENDRIKHKYDRLADRHDALSKKFDSERTKWKRFKALFVVIVKRHPELGDELAEADRELQEWEQNKTGRGGALTEQRTHSLIPAASGQHAGPAPSALAAVTAMAEEGKENATVPSVSKGGEKSSSSIATPTKKHRRGATASAIVDEERASASRTIRQSPRHKGLRTPASTKTRSGLAHMSPSARSGGQTRSAATVSTSARTRAAGVQQQARRSEHANNVPEQPAASAALSRPLGEGMRTPSHPHPKAKVAQAPTSLDSLDYEGLYEHNIVEAEEDARRSMPQHLRTASKSDEKRRSEEEEAWAVEADAWAKLDVQSVGPPSSQISFIHRVQEAEQEPIHVVVVSAGPATPPEPELASEARSTTSFPVVPRANGSKAPPATQSLSLQQEQLRTRPPTVPSDSAEPFLFPLPAYAYEAPPSWQEVIEESLPPGRTGGPSRGNRGRLVQLNTEWQVASAAASRAPPSAQGVAEEDDGEVTETSSAPASSAPSAMLSPDKRALPRSIEPAERDNPASVNKPQASLPAHVHDPTPPASRQQRRLDPPPISAAETSAAYDPSSHNDTAASSCEIASAAIEAVSDRLRDPSDQIPSTSTLKSNGSDVRPEASSKRRKSTYGRSAAFDAELDVRKRTISSAKLPPRRSLAEARTTTAGLSDQPLEHSSLHELVTDLKTSSKRGSSEACEVSAKAEGEQKVQNEQTATKPTHRERVGHKQSDINKKRVKEAEAASTTPHALPREPAAALDSGSWTSKGSTDRKVAVMRQAGPLTVPRRVMELQGGLSGKFSDTFPVMGDGRSDRPDEEDNEASGTDAPPPAAPMFLMAAKTHAREKQKSEEHGSRGHAKRHSDDGDPFLMGRSAKKGEIASAAAARGRTGKSRVEQGSRSAAAEVTRFGGAVSSLASSSKAPSAALWADVPSTSRSGTVKKRKGRAGQVVLPESIEEDLSAVGKAIISTRKTAPRGDDSDGDADVRTPGLPPTDDATSIRAGGKKPMTVTRALNQVEKRRQRGVRPDADPGSGDTGSHSRKRGRTIAQDSPVTGQHVSSSKRAKMEVQPSPRALDQALPARRFVVEREKDYSEPYPGQDQLRQIQKKRKEALRADPYKHKGRGAYAPQLAGALASKNFARIEINPEQNNGVSYAYQEVVRNKEARKQMHGVDCDCCKGYYEHAVRHLPVEEREAAILQLIQDSSRHRQSWEGAQTPPQYWHMGFPPTQQVEEVRGEAERLEREKREKLEKEANRCDGRYRYKPN